MLVAPKHGRVAFVKFSRAVVICSLAEGKSVRLASYSTITKLILLFWTLSGLPYQQVALLRDDTSNTFIGTGSTLDADPTHHHTAHHGSSAEELAQFWTIVEESGMICLEASVDELLEVGHRYVV